jgi:hypothetical protein
MIKTVNFWRVCFKAGIAGAFVSFMTIHLIILFSNNYYSVFYILAYLTPAVFMAIASFSWRNNYNGGVLSFARSFVINICTGIVIAILTSACIYVVYKYMNPYALEARIHLIQEGLLQQYPGQAVELDQNLLYSLMSPKYLALYFNVANLILLPFLAIIIANFAKRKTSADKSIDWFD